MKIAFFGDSIAAGMGAKGRSFPVLIAEALDADLTDLSGTARRVGQSAEQLADEGQGCDIVFIAHGPTEALLRPPDEALKHVPKKWRRPGWLDPRPYFSSRRWKRVVQWVESALRWRMKVLLMRVYGGIQWLDAEGYETKLTRLVNSFPGSRVFVLGTLPLDSRFFPGSRDEVRRYSEIGRKVAAETDSAFVDISGTCREWEDFCVDHFHPNENGHRRIADAVLAELESNRPA